MVGGRGSGRRGEMGYVGARDGYGMSDVICLNAAGNMLGCYQMNMYIEMRDGLVDGYLW